MAIEEDPPAGVPEWVVTYGDMMSLLLTFFIMLVSLSEIQADKKFRAVLESVAQKMGYPLGPLAPEGKHYPLNAMIEHMTKLGSHSDSNGKGGVKAKGIPAAENEQPHTRVTRKRDGTAVKDAVVEFNAGKLDLDPRQVEVVAASAHRLSGKRHKIEVRGSTSSAKGKVEATDQTPRQFAYERARLVADRLRLGGVDPERIKLSSVGDHFISIGDETEAATTTPDCVQIIVLDMYAEEFQGERSSG